jgi:urocanate hydratase
MVSVTQGRVIITTNQLATGTSMIYLTPHAQVKIRGKDVVIEVRDQDTRITVVVGDATVTPLNAGAGGVGQLLHTGQMAIVTNASATTTAELIRVVTVDPSVLNGFAAQIAAAERAQKIVLFETINPAGGRPPEIQAKAVVPVDLPVPLTVSPSTLRTGG